MSTEQKTLGQIAWEIETEGYGWTWAEVHDQDRAHWERIANAVAAAVFERQKSAPQPTADERVERLLSDVEMYGHANAVEARNDAFRGHESMAGRTRYDLPAMFAEIEQSARALLSASRKDAEHAAMYRWLRDEWDGLPLAGGRKGFDAAIRAAMSAKETK